MKKLSRLYHFFGSVHFAITLIGTTALFVIIGTIIESKTGSHRMAAKYTYGHPAFLVLLSFFFINILFATLRRWPFRKKHVPFIITHLGLLMLLAGAMIKGLCGTQGSLSVMEGSGSSEIYVADTYAVKVVKKDPQDTERLQSGYFDLGSKQSPFADLQIELTGYAPHSEEKVETWIKRGHAVLAGIRPFPLRDWRGGDTDVTPAVSAALLPDPSPQWHFLAFRCTSVAEAARELYLNGVRARLSDDRTGAVLYEASLSDLLEAPLNSGKTSVSCALDFAFCPIEGFKDPKLTLRSSGNSQSVPTLEIPLQGSHALTHLPLGGSYSGRGPLRLDLLREPLVCLLQDQDEDTYLFAFDAHGRVHCEPFRQENLRTLAVYDSGFGGYSVLAHLPFSPEEGSRSEAEKQRLLTLQHELQRAVASRTPLSPPLALLQKTVGARFPEEAVAFLKEWDSSGTWLFEDKELAIAIPWHTLPPEDRRGLELTVAFYKQIAPEIAQGKSVGNILAEAKTPFMLPPEEQDSDKLLTIAAQQIFTLSKAIKDQPFSQHAFTDAELLSAYFRLYGLHLSTILPPESDKRPASVGITLETPLTLNQRDALPLPKLEENLPRLTLRLRAGRTEETKVLTFDRFGTGLFTPSLNGNYLLRFQPLYKEIPYRVRLRNAHQITYANSSQPFSYEADVLITDMRTGAEESKTLSMNRVHETWDGYRFYLANISPPTETSVKRVQLVVNHDPAKYYATYPGGLILALGILLLFWRRNKG